MNYDVLSEEVLVGRGDIVSVSRPDVDLLKREAQKTGRERIRLCAHQDTADRLHEMLIVHPEHAYIRPHRHVKKTESTHIVEGEVDVVVFDDEGALREVLHAGDYQSGKTFYYRMQTSSYHMLLIRTPVLVFHETTNGPFDRSDTQFPRWAPSEDDVEGVRAFRRRIDELVDARSTRARV